MNRPTDGWMDGMVQVGGHHEYCDRWGDQPQGGSWNDNKRLVAH